MLAKSRRLWLVWQSIAGFAVSCFYTTLSVFKKCSRTRLWLIWQSIAGFGVSCLYEALCFQKMVADFRRLWLIWQSIAGFAVLVSIIARKLQHYFGSATVFSALTSLTVYCRFRSFLLLYDALCFQKMLAHSALTNLTVYCWFRSFLSLRSSLFSKNGRGFSPALTNLTVYCWFRSTCFYNCSKASALFWLCHSVFVYSFSWVSFGF